MAVTLNELLKTAKTAYATMVIQDLLRQSKLLQLVPFADVSGLRVVGLRWQSLPATGKRKLNAGYTEATGTTENVEETLSIYGGDVGIDRIFTKVEALFVDQLTLQTQMLTESVTRSFNNDFINGDHGVDPDGFEGLKKRVSNMPARYTINLESGGVTLDVLASAANENKFIDALHKAKTYIGGEVDMWVCNETAKIGFGQTLRRLALLDTTQDNYERTWEVFAGGKIADVGLKADLATEIILTTEGTDSVGTSIYGVKMGDETGLNGIQLGGTSPEPYDPLGGGEKEATPGYLRRMDWAIGLKNFSQNFSIVRVAGVKFV
jgi:hypothetical protein